MNSRYFNYVAHVAEGRWERRTFAAKWWQIYAGDPRWVPPYYPALRRAIEPVRNSHLARLTPTFVYIEALPGRRTSSRQGVYGLSSLSTGAIFEEPVAAAIALYDRRRQDSTAYLAWLRCANDSESLERLLDTLAEALWPLGCRRLIGPTGLSPHLETGLLQDYWAQLPSLHTPYNPPYLPEVVSGILRPLGRSRLYRLGIPPEQPAPPAAWAEFVPLEPARLAGDLLPLLAAACPPGAGFLPPDSDEAAFLLRWIGYWPLYGWLARADEQPVGFVLLQPDVAPALRRARGGRNLLWRPFLKWLSHRPVRHGRLLFGAVLPEWRGQGIGRQLLHQACLCAYNHGWQTISIGPLSTRAAAGAFLERQGAIAQQTYLLYQHEF